MKWSFIMITFILSIFCADYLDTFESIGPYRIINRETLDLNITDDPYNITVTLKSQKYIAIYGIWSTGMFKIESDEFFINQTGVSFWLDKNIADKSSLEEAFNTLKDCVFKHQTPKEAFYKKADNLEFTLAVFKKDDFKNLAIEYLNYINSSEQLSTFERNEQFEKMLKNCLVYFGVKYYNQSNKIPEDLNEYQLVIYKINTLNDFYKPLALLKKCAIDIIVNVVLTFAFFGFLLFAGRYSLSKYF